MNQIMSPAQINRELAKKQYSGTLGIVTIVSGWYQWYLPMFFDRIKKELPDAVPLVYVRGQVEIPEPWASMCKKNKDLDQFPDNGYTTAALRYVFSDTEIESFDFIHITDADMLLLSEQPDMINQHMRQLTRHNLVAYSNYAQTMVSGRPKCPGVHFVTQKWWGKTAEARARYEQDLLKNGSCSWEWDEVMLGRIIVESGFNYTTEPMFWAHHGVHLGDWRRRIQMKHPYPPPGADQQVYIRKLLADAEFMSIVELCAPHVDKLKETFTLFKGV